MKCCLLVVALPLLLGARNSNASSPEGDPPPASTCEGLDSTARAEFDARALSTLLASGLGDLQLEIECTRATLSLSAGRGSVVARPRTEARLVDQLLDLLTELLDERLKAEEPPPAPIAPTTPTPLAPIATLTPIAPLTPEVPTAQATHSRSGIDATKAHDPARTSEAHRPPAHRFMVGLTSSLWATNVPGALGLELAEQTTWHERWGFALTMSGLVGLSDAGDMRPIQLIGGGGPALRVTPWLSAEAGLLLSALLVPSPSPEVGLGSSVRPAGYFTLRAEKATTFGAFYGQVGLRVSGAGRELKRGDEVYQTIPFLEPTLGLGVSFSLARAP